MPRLKEAKRPLQRPKVFLFIGSFPDRNAVQREKPDGFFSGREIERRCVEAESAEEIIEHRLILLLKPNQQRGQLSWVICDSGSPLKNAEREERAIKGIDGL